MTSPIPTYVNNGLGFILIVRLLLLRLHHVYRVFCLFLVFNLLSSYIALSVVNNAKVYRLVWIGITGVGDVFSLWMVYAVLNAILKNYAGILRFSRRVLNITFVLAFVITLSTARLEYAVSGYAAYVDPIKRDVGVTLVFDRVIVMTALLVLLAILGFILWWPVAMPRNLAVFSIGLVFYFSLQTGVLLVRSFWSHDASEAVYLVAALALSACFAYWAIFINAEGETVPVRLGHSWHASEQKRLLEQLEAMNTALLRAAKR
jgi:hypothetical protein